MLKAFLFTLVLGDVSALRIGLRSSSTHCAVPRSTPIQAGLFDAFAKAFSNEEFDDRNAKAQHILLKGGDEDTRAAAAETIKGQIESGELTFEAAAKQFSECPSRAEMPAGSLGQFSPGKMVAEFDEYIFNPKSAVGAIGIVETQFGTHLVKINERKENLDPSVQRVDGSPLF
uniref:Peptidyl-prolyl cis-trans isomerase n=1 Tax=Haptolina ericina TaxID=156174 RepID=A0A7S3BIS7_9EUKA|mmetsp:Transcript_60996/g.135913  ORF Transcript_60996/g.135913 Transcript_60996/m.135913 type:complete len:173 (+) Transcript_60996:18-536(+)